MGAQRLFIKVKNVALHQECSKNTTALLLALVFFCITILLLKCNDAGVFDDTSERAQRHNLIQQRVQAIKGEIGGFNDVKSKLPHQCLDPELQSDFKLIMLQYPKLKVTVAMLMAPDMNDFAASISSFILTTSPFHSQMELIIIPDGVSEENVRNMFEMIEKHGSPNSHLSITVLSPQLKGTLFQEMIEITDSFKDSDIVITASTEITYQPGWMEGIITSLMAPNTEPGNSGPIIVTPSIAGFVEYPNQISFSQEFRPDPKPRVVKKRFRFDLIEGWLASEYLAYPSVAFLPDIFAVLRKSPGFDSMMSFFKDNDIQDATTLDAALYSWRCLKSPVMILPCSKITINADKIESFDPIANEDTEERVVETWFHSLTKESKSNVYVNQYCESKEEFAEAQNLPFLSNK